MPSPSRRAAIAAALAVTCVAATTVAAQSQSPTAPEDPGPGGAGAQRPIPFEYKGRRGPERWGSLSRRYAICADGAAQSPIDLARARPSRLPNLRFDYRVGDLRLENTTHTVQANEAQGSSLVADGQRYELLQFHFHEPSEHVVGGRRFAGEMHFVHRDPEGRVAVVSVLVRRGKRKRALEPVFDRLPRTKGATATVRGFDTAALLPTGRRRFTTYGGSLTTPPCSEGVRWYVLSTPIEASAGQLAAFRRAVSANARPVQPRNNRVVRVDRD